MTDDTTCSFRNLEDALELIKSQAENHKSSVAYNDGENIALVNIVNIARIALQDAKVSPSQPRQAAPMNDLLATIRHLSEALQRYGNKNAMSFAPPHLQASIDDAMTIVFEKDRRGV